MAMMLDWSLPLAIATFSLAGAAFWAIWQNYVIRKEEREISHKLALLEEIDNCSQDCKDAILTCSSRLLESAAVELRRLDVKYKRLVSECEIYEERKRLFDEIKTITNERQLNYLMERWNYLGKRLDDIHLGNTKESVGGHDEDTDFVTRLVPLSKSFGRFESLTSKSFWLNEETAKAMSQADQNMHELIGILLRKKLPGLQKTREIFNKALKSLDEVRNNVFVNKLALLTYGSKFRAK